MSFDFYKIINQHDTRMQSLLLLFIFIHFIFLYLPFSLYVLLALGIYL